MLAVAVAFQPLCRRHRRSPPPRGGASFSFVPAATSGRDLSSSRSLSHCPRDRIHGCAPVLKPLTKWKVVFAVGLQRRSLGREHDLACPDPRITSQWVPVTLPTPHAVGLRGILSKQFYIHYLGRSNCHLKSFALDYLKPSMVNRSCRSV
jgi:hypothetical protein